MGCQKQKALTRFRMRALGEASRLDACWSAHPVAIIRSQSAVMPRPCVAVVVVIEMTRQLPNMLTAVYRLGTAAVNFTVLQVR